MGSDQAVRYLLIAGYADGRRGRPDHRVSVFSTPEDARAHFRRLHQRRSAAVWAEVVAVDLAGRLATLWQFRRPHSRAAAAQAATSCSAGAGSPPTWRWT
jgi:hypothetical protein